MKLVMLVKVYPRRLSDQCVAALCVIWVQNNHGGRITCLEAHDFGTRARHRSEIAHLQNGHKVDETFEYTMPQLHRLPLLDRITQNATMPALHMLAHVTNEKERTILNSILTIRDDMKFASLSWQSKSNYAFCIFRMLPLEMATVQTLAGRIMHMVGSNTI